MLLRNHAQLDARKAAVAPGGPLAPLHDALARELEPLLERELYVPSAKALLSRAGGRCPLDDTLLEFDPFSPHRHRCPSCGTVQEGELHHRWWVTFYQLWLAERAVHGALFAALRGDSRHRRVSRDILLAYADRYLTYPNVDNVLGPTRLFFSTYLESIWLLQVCIAASLLEQQGEAAVVERVRDAIVEPSRRIIEEFDEGRSNRQVWHNAALMAAAALCGDTTRIDARVSGPSGLLEHLSGALLADGSWYEGENYHQFALRGLWYGVTLAEAGGIGIPRELVHRFDRAFAVPFATALPDFTMPSRKDSQYAVSLRQWRLAELTELGFARTGEPALRQALARCYEPGHERRDTGRARSTADVERNFPSGALSRADLGWRALLFALPELPPARPAAPRSAHLPGQGYAVFRRDGDVYVGVDYGQSGGGHGHPDRLNVTLYEGTTRWMDDMGTGSYVDPSLHWYRSTLAHNAPLVDGRSQPLGDGELRAYDEREGMGWVRAEFGLADGVSFERAVVVAPDYLVDELRWETGPEPCRVELPIHLAAEVRDAQWRRAALDGGAVPEDGFSYVTGVRATSVRAGVPVAIEASRDGRTLRGIVRVSCDATLFAAAGPGQPPTTTRPFLVLRAQSAAGTKGAIRSVITWNAAARIDGGEGDDVVVEYPDGERHVHRRMGEGWHVDLFAGGARSSIDLDGVVRTRRPDRRDEPPPAPVILPRVPVTASQALTFELREAHNRRSESSWRDAGSPAASVALSSDGERLLVLLDVRAGDPTFPAPDATNPYDNEHRDTMGAGVQLYLRTREGAGGWALVPQGDGGVRVRSIGGAAQLSPPGASWRATAAGYQLTVTAPLPPSAAAGTPFDVDVIVNETIRGRVRRRGQLLLTGARGEWVYLRGDRHDDSRWLRVVIR